MNAVILVKPHIKQFLITQCGDPVDLNQIPEMWDFFRDRLRKPSYHQDSKLIANYPEEILISITEDMFYRYGWELSKTDTVRFNRKIDNYIKLISRQYISIHVAFGSKQTSAVKKFLEVFDFGSTIDTDTMVKDFYRNGPKICKNQLYSKIINDIEDNLLVNLSSIGMVSQHFLNYKKADNGKRSSSISRC